MSEDSRSNLGMSLFIPYRYTEERMFKAVQEAGFNDWTLAQCRVLQRISTDGSRLTDLAEQAQMTKQNTGVMVDQLERLGYVARIADPSDGRARLIVLEQRGKQAVQVAMKALDEIHEEWKEYLGTRNFSLLEELLGQLREITDPYAK